MAKPTWGSTNPNSGNGNSAVSVTAEENKTTSPRSGNLEVAGSNISKNVTVNQKEKLVVANFLPYGVVFIEDEGSSVPIRQPNTSVSNTTFASQDNTFKYIGRTDWEDDTENAEFVPELTKWIIEQNVYGSFNFSQLFESDVNGTFFLQVDVYDNNIGSGTPLVSAQAPAAIDENQVKGTVNFTIPPITPDEYNEITLYFQVSINRG